MKENFYTLEKYRDAPDSNLDAEEAAFAADYARRLEGIIQRINRTPGSKVQPLLQELFRPDLWRVLMNLSKAEQVIAKEMESKAGLFVLAREEAEELNAEYDRRADRVVSALREFGDFVEQVNAHSSRGE